MNRAIMPRIMLEAPRLPPLITRPNSTAGSTVRTVLFRLDGAAAAAAESKLTYSSAAQPRTSANVASQRANISHASRREDALLNVRPTISSCGKQPSAATASIPEPAASAMPRKPFPVERLRELMPSPPSGESRDHARRSGVLRSSLSDSYCCPSPRQNDGVARLQPLPPRDLQRGHDPPRLQLYGDGDSSLVSSHLYAHNPLLLRPYTGAHHYHAQMPNGRHTFRLTAISSHEPQSHSGASRHAILAMRKQRYLATENGCDSTVGQSEPTSQGPPGAEREKRRVKFVIDCR